MAKQHSNGGLEFGSLSIFQTAVCFTISAESSLRINSVSEEAVILRLGFHWAEFSARTKFSLCPMAFKWN